ncbi:hypothetical protein [Nitrosopumilus sp. b2]|uniref:hypothetical protein n=1 Tax=Nitrosopumilus sp. b2 TaxID=2109908 RepID=UPI0015F5316F|nr:hypothetical protein [Nitrosopumilus sp. b2]KAF6245117.1 hypothetical protein C6989_05370 [Nitrosopumilus sp. b2]
MISPYPGIKGKLFLGVTLGLITFGLFNIVTQSYAISHEGIDLPESLKAEDLLNYAVLQGISQIGPLLAGILPLGFSYLRKQGIKIDKDAEAYFIKTIPKLVENQSRWIYEEMKDSQKMQAYIDADEANGISERVFPKSLGETAFDNVKKDLLNMLKEDGFRDSTKKILKDNMKNAIETAVTQNNKALTDRSRNLIGELSPLIIDALLLAYATPDEARAAKQDIIKSAKEAIQENFDFEEIMYDKNLAEIFIKSELNKKIGQVN